MKRTLLLIAAVFLMAAGTMAATNSGEFSNAPFTSDSLELSATSYTKICSLAVTPDTAGNTVFLISGALEMTPWDWVYIALATDTNSSGVPEIVLGNDTTTTTVHEYYWKAGYADMTIRFPFSTTQYVNTDTTSAVTLYLLYKLNSANFPSYLHDVRIEAITNLADQP